jgi:hypothetical protein
MDIGIIGAGQIGGSLTRRLTQLGHNVRVSNSRDPETLAELAAETGATAVWARDAAVDADLVIVSIPQKNVVDLVPAIVATAKPGAPIIETNNYYPRQRDGRIEAIEAGTPESVWVSKQLGVPVFKVFNGIYWRRCSAADSHAEAPDESRCRWPATMSPRRSSFSTWSTSWDSTRLTADLWPNPGASSPGPRSTAVISTPRARFVRSPKPHRNGSTTSGRPPDQVTVSRPRYRCTGSEREPVQPR